MLDKISLSKRFHIRILKEEVDGKTATKRLNNRHIQLIAIGGYRNWFILGSGQTISLTGPSLLLLTC